MDLGHLLVIHLVTFSFCFHYGRSDMGEAAFVKWHDRAITRRMGSLSNSFDLKNHVLHNGKMHTNGHRRGQQRHNHARRIVNVDNYGRKGDGSVDNKAFEQAWKEVCSSPYSPIFLVPKSRNYLLKPIVFSGPCKSRVTVKIEGRIDASANRQDWKLIDYRHWVLFQDVTNLIVEGGGIIDGKGHIWWENSCKINTSLPCTEAPTALSFYNCNVLDVDNLIIKDSQQIHLSFEKCTNVRASRLIITAPELSPNTDGIHVGYTRNMDISDCVIGTGDDCIAIVTGSQQIRITNIKCGPGHGISIGSLGSNNSAAHVSNVIVDKVFLSGTTNGARIKTWQGGYGRAKDIIFQNIAMHNVQNPLIINQNYCDSKDPCHEQKSAVQVSNIIYRNIKGTSASKVAMTFSCSSKFPCRQVLMQDIDLIEEGGGTTKSLCNNIKWAKEGRVVPQPCQ